MTLGDIIRDRREQLKMTQEDLGIAVGVSKATVSRWESGAIHKMKAPMINSLAKTLNLDPVLFLQDEEVLFPDEVLIIKAYRIADSGTRASVRKLLDIPEKNSISESSAI